MPLSQIVHSGLYSKDIIDSLPGIYYRSKNDERYSCLLVSAGCKEITGYGPEEVVSIVPLVFEPDVAHFRNQRESVLKTNETLTFTFRLCSKNGRYQEVSETLKAVFGKSGNFEYFEGFIHPCNPCSEQNDALTGLELKKLEIEGVEKLCNCAFQNCSVEAIADMACNIIESLVGVSLARMYLVGEAGQVLKLQNRVNHRVSGPVPILLQKLSIGAEIGKLENPKLLSVLAEQSATFFWSEEKIVGLVGELVYTETDAPAIFSKLDFKALVGMGLIPLSSPENLVGLVICVCDEHVDECTQQVIARLCKHLSLVLTKQANDLKLEDMRLQLKFIQDNSPDIMLTIDSNCIITYVNDTAKCLSQEDPTAKSILDFVTPSCQAEYLRNIRDAFEGVETSFEMEGYARDFNLARYYIRMRRIPISEDRYNVLIVSTNTTDTKFGEQKASNTEARYRTLFEKNLAGVYRASMDDVIMALRK